MKQMTEKEALARLTALCSQAERCSYDMEENMRRWELPEDAAARVMAYLTEHKFVDDGRFARAFVTDKIRYNKWGRRKVEQALWAKRIDSGIRQSVLDGVDDEEYLCVLRPLLRSKARSVKAADIRELNRKLVRFALGRGFDYRLIRLCIDVADDDMEDGYDGCCCVE